MLSSVVASARFAMASYFNTGQTGNDGLPARPHRNFVSSDIIFGNIFLHVLKHCKSISFHYMFKSLVLLTFTACILYVWILYPNQPFSEKGGGYWEHWRCYLLVGFNSIHLHFINCINIAGCYSATFIYSQELHHWFSYQMYFSVWCTEL